ncbi:MAG: signal recognition particle-docking protein FtsY [Bdellovibrionota bacterium]
MVPYLTQNHFLSIAGIFVAIVVIFLFVGLIKNRNQRNLNKRNKHKHKETAVVPEKRAGQTPVAESYRAKVLVEQDEKLSWFRRLRFGLSQTHRQIIKNLDEFFLSEKLKLNREDTLEYLFELLVQADVGVATAETLVERVKNRLERDDYNDVEKFKTILKEEILLLLNTLFENKNGTIENSKHTPHVVLMVGVNGAGKTTTIGKLAYKAHLNNKKVVIGAADTFRAAAVEQLAIWADRAHAKMVNLKEGSDPASVAYEATKIAAEQKLDVCLIDTAGRLQTRHDLMQELSKIARVTGKDVVDAPHEVLLVLDATTGQNALQQAKLFREAVNVTGIILTKLDGTAKGGIAIAISHELGLPIRYVGVGETVDDLELFDAVEFVDALFHN